MRSSQDKHVDFSQSQHATWKFAHLPYIPLSKISTYSSKHETSICMHTTIQFKMLMNLLALSFLVTSLVTAGVWSPTTNQQQRQKEDLIVKEGHRVVVVQYDENGERNTKVSISSPPPHFGKETIKEAASVFPNLGQGISHEGHTGSAGAGKNSQGTGELICDAFGKCTRSIASAFGKAKDKVSDKAQDTKDKVSETAQEVKDKVSETAHESKDKVAETAQKAKGDVGDALGKAKERVIQKGQESIDKAKASAKGAKDVAKTLKGDIVTNVTENMETVQKKAMEGAQKAKDNTQQAAEKVKTGSNKFFNGLKYMTSMEAMKTVMGIANLLGLATAYGISVWVTFISSYVLSGVLPRQQFGVVQSKIYPVYFRAMAYSIGLALLGHCLGERKRLFSSKPEMFQTFNLLSSVLMVLVNTHYLEPKATKVMFERMKMEKEEGRGRDDLVGEGSGVTEQPRTREPSSHPVTTTTTTVSSEEEVVRSRMAKLNERLKKLNANSSLLNVFTLMGLNWHLVYLGQRLGFSC